MPRPHSRRDAALTLLAETGMSRANYAPWLHRLLWWLGFDLPPPHFASFGAAALLQGCFFGLTWGGLMWLMVWSQRGMSGGSGLAVAALGGSLFGLAMAAYYAHGRKKYQLPDWRSLAEPE